MEAAMNDRDFKKHLQEIARGDRPIERASIQQPEPRPQFPALRKPPAKARLSNQRVGKKKAS
jgi:hypothetical protein